MKIHSHIFTKKVRADIVDGAILMHQEMLRILKAEFTLVPHDITDGIDCLKAVENGDVVYAGTGPYAYLYHYWREKTGKDFRIIREVHTSFWSAYWTQEELCEPMHRDGDIALFPTDYTRCLFEKHFDYGGKGSAKVLYPFIESIDTSKALDARSKPRDRMNVGYLGALSDAKNFDQVMQSFAGVYSENSLATLHIAGKPNNEKWSFSGIMDQAKAFGIDKDAVSHYGILPRDQLAEFFNTIDVLVFPSTASRETLGRVVIEAAKFNVPVLGANIGPCVELLPKENLLKTRLKTGSDFTMGRCVALGEVSNEELTHKILERTYKQVLQSQVLLPYKYATFTETLFDDCLDAVYQESDRTIVDAVNIGSRTQTSVDHALSTIEAYFLAFFRGQDRPSDLHWDFSEADREIIASVFSIQEREISDYRGFPKLLDTIVTPLNYQITK